MTAPLAGTRNFAYDDENELISVWQTNVWREDYVYDGKLRRRITRQFTWNGSGWQLTNEVHYVYDGNVVIQERDQNNLPVVTYTRGVDLSGTLQGAGGIGGLLARTDMGRLAVNDPLASAYYHADGNGNITALITDLMDTNQVLVAKYLYDPYGNLLAESGPLAGGNKYRFSSKEWDSQAGLYYYLYRFYDPNLQRWPNRDPIQEIGGFNLYEFVANNPIEDGDFYGLASIVGPGGGLGGLSGPFKRPPGPWNWRELGKGGLGVFGGTLLSNYGMDKMAGCGSNCKKSDCESCCKKGAAIAAAGDIAGSGVGCIGTFGWGCVFSMASAALNGYEIYNAYNSCMAGCASKSN